MNMIENFLTMYDTCKRARPPEQCRELVKSAVPSMVGLHLRGYDLCLRGLAPERCRELFSPAQDVSRTPVLAFAAGAIVGLLLGRLL